MLALLYFFFFCWLIIRFLSLLFAKFYKELALFNLLKEWTLAYLILLNWLNDLIKLINLVLLLFFFLQSLFFSFLLPLLLLFQFSFFFFQPFLLFLLSNFFLSFLIFSLFPLLFFLPCDKLLLHLSHPFYVFYHKLLFRVFYECAVICVF